ncbi:MAG: FAD-binding oxidoreductase [Caldilineaceae bacterium]|nr:FAD-binding oxidoreductase [Caldilineaceae bacterium]
MDYVIIGGGVYGCGVAWELARLGAEVMLLEATTVAAGASGGGGKRGVRANGRDLRELSLMQMAYPLWPHLHEELGHDTGYQRIGHLQLVERERDLAGLSARAWMQNQQGIETQLLDAAAVRTYEPHVNEDVLGALYCPLDGIADHTATTKGYATAAKRAGAVLREQTPIVKIEESAGRVTAVYTATDERITVGKALILLANSAVPRLLHDTFQLTLPVWSRVPQYLVTTVVDPLPLRHLIGHAHRRLAMKALPGGQVMISGGWLGVWDAEQKQGVTVPDQVAGNLAEAVALYPTLADVPVAYAAADRLETETADGIPIIDRVSGVENLYYGVGWSGHGWAIAPAVVKLMAAWISTGQPSAQLAPFAYKRFQS